MKTIITLVNILLAVEFALGQSTPDSFAFDKKSFDLSTGICISYVETGKAGGTPLLFLHGYSDTSRSFKLVIEDLIQINKNVRVIAPDLRGHGDTSMPDENQCKAAPEKCFTPDDFAKDVIDLMDKLGIQKAHIVGHSMGSVIAQNLALNHSDRIFSMVLIGAFVNGKECDAIQEFLLRDMIEQDWRCALEKQNNFTWPDNAYSISPRDMGDRIMTFLKENWVVETAAAKEFLNDVFGETVKIPLGTWIGAMRALGEVDYRAALKNLKIPTLILWATQDGVTAAKDQEQVKSAFQSAAKLQETKVIYKTYGKSPFFGAGYPPTELGHNMHWAAHKAVAADVNSFILEGKALTNLPCVNPSNGKVILVEDANSVQELE